MRMNIKSCVLLSAIAACHLPLMAEEATLYDIQEICVFGNKRVPLDDIRDLITKSKGNLSTFDLDHGLKMLYKSSLFQDIDMRVYNKALHVYVTENPVIGDVSFVGNKTFDSEQLKTLLSAKCYTGKMYDMSTVMSVANMIMIVYQQHGISASVTPHLKYQQYGIIDVIFYVKESPKTYLKRISFDGNESINSREIRDNLFSSTFHPLLFWRKGRSMYTDYHMQMDISGMEHLYNDRGYLDFKVVDRYLQRSKDGGSGYLTYFVDEGPQYHVNTISVINDYNGDGSGEFEEALTLHSGDVCSSRALARNVAIIDKILRKQGYIGHNVRYEVKKNGDKADVRMIIEHKLRRTIRRITVEGNYRTINNVIYRELLLKDGDLLDKRLLEASIERLKALELFEEVTYSIDDFESEEGCVIRIEVKEKQSIDLGARVGFNSAEGGLNAKITMANNNFLGTGSTLLLEMDAFGHNVGITCDYFMPKLLNSDKMNFGTRLGIQSSDGTVSSFNLARLNELDADCISSTYDFEPYISGYWSQHLAYEVGVSLKHEYKFRKFNNSSFSDYNIRRWRTPLHMALRYSRYIKPMKSYITLSTEHTVSFLGAKYITHVGSASLSIPIGASFSLHTGLEVGYMHEISNCTPYDRFILANGDIRGFDLITVRHPVKLKGGGIRHKPYGGNMYWKGKTTLKAHINQKMGLNLIAFLDTGSVYGIGKNYDGKTDRLGFMGENSNIRRYARLSAGFGFEWLRSPICGPLTFVVSFPILSSRHEHTSRWDVLPMDRFSKIQHPSTYMHL